MGDELADEFAEHFQGNKTPHVLITTSRTASVTTLKFVNDLRVVIPNSEYYRRKNYHLKSIIEFAKNRSFTCVLVVLEDRKIPSNLR